MDSTRHYWLYVLHLEHDKYYVGITSRKDPQDRIHQHGTWYGARWTKKHRPVKTLQIKDLGYATKERAEHFEQEVFQKYVNEYGVQNVRGGRVTTPESVMRVGKIYFTKEMLGSFATALLLMFCAAYIFLHR